MKSFSTIVSHNYSNRYVFLIAFLIGMFLTTNSISQTQWGWVTSFGGQKSDAGRSVCVDDDDNVYITGYFQGISNFHDIELTSKGDTDIFLAKLDQFGNLLWIRQFGSEVQKNLIATEMGKALCVDELGNVYLTGIFSLSATFGDTTLNSIGGDDIFVAKINSRGDVVWANNYGSRSHDIVYDIGVTRNGKIIISGEFGSIPDMAVYRSKSNASYSFVASIVNGGEMDIIRSVSNRGSGSPNVIVIDINNCIYWAVNYNNSLTLDEDKIQSSGKSDFFIEKIGSSNETLWQKNIGGSSDDRVNSISVINEDELLFTGSFEKELSIDDEVIISNGMSDILICHLDKAGGIIWLEGIGGSLDDYGATISPTLNGDIIIGTNFQKRIVIQNDTIVSSDYYDAALFGYDNNHHLTYINQIGGDEGDFLRSVAIGNGTAYFTGNFRSSLYENMTQISSEGSDDIMLFAFTPDLTNNLISIEGNEDIGVDFTILPNPSNGNISISSNLIEVINVGLVINDAVGNKIKEIRNLTIPGNINLSGLSNGVYFIHISYNKNSFIKKAVIKH